MIKRYKESYNFGTELNNDGKFVLFADAVADKAAAVAEAVEKATAAMRAELVKSLERQFRRCAWYDDGWYRIDVLNSGCDYGDRLVKLKAWEKETQNEVECYRPIESRNSGRSDEI